MILLFHTQELTNRSSCCFAPMKSFQSSSVGRTSLKCCSSATKMPVLLLDVMGTIVRDPFYDDVPSFFGLSMKELMAVKHPTAWIEFEKGLIGEDELKSKFFTDGRSFDYEGLKACMYNGYKFIDGMESLLQRLKKSGYAMHAFTNYPQWYRMIEKKLELSQYLSWTFVSCHTGKMKPEKEAYSEALEVLQLDAADCTFVDDQERNVEGAQRAGMVGIIHKSATQLHDDLTHLGFNLL